MTAAALFAQSLGTDLMIGDHRCFYCLASCDGTYLSVKYVTKTFTARDTVGGGEFVCSGCIEALKEKADIVLPGGEKRSGQKVRNYSWIITETRAVAATKAHKAYLRENCLAPPSPPFVICLSDSGQKHLLYRAVVCWSQKTITLTLEVERITYAPHDLFKRLTLCMSIAAVLGKPALSTPLSTMQEILLVESMGTEESLNQWQSVHDSPLSRLAAWLTPKKEDCQNATP